MKLVSRLSNVLRFGALSAALCALGCTELKPGSDGATIELDARWRCLLEPEAPRLPTFEPQPPFVVYAVPIFDFANPVSVVPDLKISVCQASDSVCPDTAVVGQLLGMQPTDVVLNGLAVKDVPIYAILAPFGLEIYLKMSAPGYLSQEYYFGGALVGDRLIGEQQSEFFDLAAAPPAIPQPLRLPLMHGEPLTPVRVEHADNLANQAGVVRDADQGLLVVRTIDCGGQVAEGVTLMLDNPAQGQYYAFRSSLAVSTDPPLPSDVSGLAGFANIPIGEGQGSKSYSINVTGVAPGGVEYGEAVFVVRPSHLTVGEIRPDWGLYGR